MKTIFLHIGIEKTGTTSIQAFFNENRGALQEKGLLYPDLSTFSKFKSHSHSHSHSVLTSAIMKSSNRVNIPEEIKENVKASDILTSIKDQVLTDESIFISSEHLSSRLNIQDIVVLKNEVQTHLPNYKIKIVICLRRQDQLFKSSYSTMIKSGTTKSLDEYYDEALNRSPYFDYKTMLKNWEMTFGFDNLIIYSFDEAKEIGVITKILSVIGFCHDVDESRYVFNESLSNMTNIAGAAINKDGDNRQRKLNLLSKLTNSLEGQLIEQEKICSITQRYYVDNSYIAKFYLNRKSLFDSDYYIWKDNYIALNVQDSQSEIIRVLLRHSINEEVAK